MTDKLRDIVYEIGFIFLQVKALCKASVKFAKNVFSVFLPSQICLEKCCGRGGGTLFYSGRYTDCWT